MLSTKIKKEIILKKKNHKIFVLLLSFLDDIFSILNPLIPIEIKFQMVI